MESIFAVIIENGQIVKNPAMAAKQIKKGKSLQTILHRGGGGAGLQ